MGLFRVVFLKFTESYAYRVRFQNHSVAVEVFHCKTLFALIYSIILKAFAVVVNKLYKERVAGVLETGI